MVPETVWRALCSVEGLRVGEGIERPPVRALPTNASPPSSTASRHQIRAMVDLQIWSACRPGEACIMRAIDINMQGKIWEYRPHSHKAEHHEKERVIYLGPHAQEIIKPWLKTDLHAYLFSPKEGSCLVSGPEDEEPEDAKVQNWSESPSEKSAEACSWRSLHCPRLRPCNPPWLRTGFRHAQRITENTDCREGRQR